MPPRKAATVEVLNSAGSMLALPLDGRGPSRRLQLPSQHRFRDVPHQSHAAVDEDAGKGGQPVAHRHGRPFVAADIDFCYAQLLEVRLESPQSLLAAPAGLAAKAGD